MTVKELREKLAKYPDNMKVTIATDWRDVELTEVEISPKENDWVNTFKEETLRLLWPLKNFEKNSQNIRMIC